MVFLPNPIVDIDDHANRLYDAWLGSVEEGLEDPSYDRYELCRTLLTEIHYPNLVGVDPTTLPLSTQVLLAQMDTRSVTLEPEYYAETDLERYDRVKLPHLALGGVRQERPGRERPPGGEVPEDPGEADLSELREELQGLPPREALLRLQPRGGR